MSIKIADLKLQPHFSGPKGQFPSQRVGDMISGEHPRIGALDVCPFIPVKNVSMEDCVECAKEFGERLATELGVPGE